MITIAISSAIILLFAFLLAPSGWSDVLSSSRNELVFAGRNRDYGAYKLRREHHRTLLLAMLLGMGGLGSLLIVPALLAEAPSTAPLSPPHVTDAELVEFVLPVPPAPLPPAPRPAAPKSAITSGYTAVDTTTAVIDTTTAPTGPVTHGPVDTTGTGLPPTGGGNTGATDTDSTEVKYADVAPEYPGGMKALYKDIGNMMRYPEIDRAAGRQGQVKLVFVVGMDGRVSDVQVMRGVSTTIDAEAVRVFKQLKRWKPGSFAGRPVNTRYSIPIRFTLQ